MSDELIRHRLVTAATDNRLASWQDQVKFKAKLGFESEPRISDSCFRLAAALGRRDMVGFDEEGFAGELPIEMLGPAVIGGRSLLCDCYSTGKTCPRILRISQF